MTTQFQDTDLSVMRGDLNTFTFSVLSGAAGFDLTGYSVYAQARLHEDHKDYIFDTRSTTGMAIANGSNGTQFNVGKIILQITAAISKILPIHSKYDLQAHNGSSDPTTLASGNLILKKDVTR